MDLLSKISNGPVVRRAWRSTFHGLLHPRGVRLHLLTSKMTRSVMFKGTVHCKNENPYVFSARNHKHCISCQVLILLRGALAHCSECDAKRIRTVSERDAKHPRARYFFLQITSKQTWYDSKILVHSIWAGLKNININFALPLTK